MCDTEVAAVDIVSHEHVLRVGNIASEAEQLLQVIVLAVNVSANSARGGNRLRVIDMQCTTYNHVGFLHENILREAAEQLQFFLLQRRLVSQFSDPSIQIGSHVCM